MKTIELLAPAGDQESLIAAIQNGANAVYLGGSSFNARAFAKNFDNEQLKWAVEYAHLRNVKIYVTVNTLYQDQEFTNLIDYLDFLYDIQIDAVIVQDIGLFRVIKSRYQDFEVHISTQASVMNSYGVKYYEESGANRIVLARENTIEEIHNICQSTSLEIEVFVHGALCVCYSGQCLMSSLIGHRSGNRGSCAQPCRLQYRFMKNGQLQGNKVPFLLSPRDMMTIHHIGELIDAGVTSFKIEGRMKRPEYVASVIRAYRKAIDAHLYKHIENLKMDIYDMKAMFNRNYTEGYAFHDHQIIDGDYSGNKGVIIGEVIHYNPRQKLVSIKLRDSLFQGDSIVFETIDKGRPVNKIYMNSKLVSHANEGDIIAIEFDNPVYKGNVRKTVDTQVISRMKKTYEKENVKLKIDMKFIAKIDSPAILIVKYKNITITKKTFLNAELANYRALDVERIHQQLSKLGNSCFYVEQIDIEIDKMITLPIKEINQLRRQAIDELSHQLMSQIIHHNSKKDIEKLIKKPNQHQEIHVLVSNLNQLYEVSHHSIQCIYYPFQSDVEEAYRVCIESKKEFALFIPRICKEEDIEEILNHPIYHKINKVVVNEVGAYYAFSDKERILGTGMNIYNSYSCSYFKEKKILSLEMSKNQIQALQTNLDTCFIQIYGKIENMISEYCPISEYYLGYQKKKCDICKKGAFSLIDRKDEKFDLIMDEKCRMHLLNCRTLFIDQLIPIEVKKYFIHFTNENYQNLRFIMNDLMNVINNHKKSEIKTKMKTTLGYFKE